MMPVGMAAVDDQDRAVLGEAGRGHLDRLAGARPSAAGGVMTSATRASKDSGVLTSRVRRSCSVTVPTTSARANGGSALTTGTCETPYSRRIAMASRTVSSGWTWTRGGSDGVPLRCLWASSSVTVSVGRSARAEEAVVRHPAVVVELGEVAPAGVGDDHDDDGVAPGLVPDLEGGPDGGTGGAADEDPLLAGDPAGGQEAVAVRDHDDPVGDVAVVGVRPEVLTDALDEIGTTAATRVHRSLGIRSDDLDVRVLGLQVATDARRWSLRCRCWRPGG